MAAKAWRKDSQELTDTTLPKTIAFAAKNQGPIKKPKAPHRSATMRGNRKQAEILMLADATLPKTIDI